MLRHVVLLCSATNNIDASALESLEAIDNRLNDTGVLLHCAEITGPVMDRLRSTSPLQHLRDRVFIRQYQAVEALTPDVTAKHVTHASPAN